MRSTIIPAQITTVEDKIVGSLELSQVFLLSVPVFGGSGLFIFLPPFFNYAVYKIAIIICIGIICSLLAVRIKGKILLFWLIISLHYNIRPRYYVYNKNDSHMRNVAPHIKEKVAEEPKVQRVLSKRLPKLSATELARIEELINNPQANLHFKTNRKGEMCVHITEVN